MAICDMYRLLGLRGFSDEFFVEFLERGKTETTDVGEVQFIHNVHHHLVGAFAFQLDQADELGIGLQAFHKQLMQVFERHGLCALHAHVPVN